MLIEILFRVDEDDTISKNPTAKQIASVKPTFHHPFFQLLFIILLINLCKESRFPSTTQM